MRTVPAFVCCLAAAILVPSVGSAAMRPPAKTGTAAPVQLSDVMGTWHARLLPTPGNPVDFELKVTVSAGKLSATLVNGETKIPFAGAAWDGETLSLALEHLDARIEARRTEAGLGGQFTRVIATGKLEIPFEASRTPPKAPEPRTKRALDGEWGVTIGTGEKAEKAIGILKQKGAKLGGTLRTSTGDYGSLHGFTDGETLVLTSFDGIHVYRFTGSVNGDAALAGEFRSRANPPVPWTARRLKGGEGSEFLPDLFGVVRAKDPAAPYTFSFPDAEGRTVESSSFAGKPLVVVFFGTWCPNCNEEAPVLVELHRKYSGRGLEIVALAFEYTDDVERNRRQIARFEQRYGVPYTVLLAGTTTTAPTSPAMTQLIGWQGYPTTLFLDRSHRVVRIHSGFDGPATGEHHVKLKKEMEETVERLLK